MRVEKQVAKPARMHTEMRIVVSIERDIKEIFTNIKILERRKLGSSILFAFSVN